MRKVLLTTFICGVMILSITGCSKNKQTLEDDLQTINNKIIDYFQTNGVEDFENYTFNYVDEENNVVVVGLLDNSKEEQEKFKKMIVDSDLIQFVKGERLVDEEQIENLRDTIKIKVKDSINNVFIKTIDDSANIESIINAMKHSVKLPKDAIVTTELYSWIFEMYNENEQLITKVYVWESGFIGFDGAKEYSNSTVQKIIDNIK